MNTIWRLKHIYFVIDDKHNFSSPKHIPCETQTNNNSGLLGINSRMELWDDQWSDSSKERIKC